MAGDLDIGHQPDEDLTVNVAHIRARLREGFRPFAIVTSSGNKYPVPHPEFIFLTQRTVIVADQRGYTVNLDPLHVVGIEDIPVHRNGRSRRRSKRLRHQDPAALH